MSGLTREHAIDFSFVEFEGDYDPSVFVEVLQGRVAGCVFRGFATAAECDDALAAMRRSAGLRQRDGEASGGYVGTYHWGRTHEQYRVECERMKGVVATAFHVEGPWARFVASTDALLQAEHGLVVRAARWQPESGEEVVAVAPVGRSWDGSGEYALGLHEDHSQCTDPRQSGFEVQFARPELMAAVNICLENDGGGDLILWDHRPDRAERDRYGTTVTGGPYPEAAVAHCRRIDLPVRAGDLYFFGGGLVHAVGPMTGRRTTISALHAQIADSTVLRWT